MDQVRTCLLYDCLMLAPVHLYNSGRSRIPKNARSDTNDPKIKTENIIHVTTTAVLRKFSFFLFNLQLSLV